MNIDQILDIMDDMLDKAWSLPLSGGKCVVDIEKLRDLMDNIRLNMPGEIKQAKAIVSDRSDIISVAKKEAADIVRKAEEHARRLVADEEVVKQAQAKAAEIMSMAQRQSREMKQASNDYADNLLKNAEEVLCRAAADIKETRQNIRNPKRNEG